MSSSLFRSTTHFNDVVFQMKRDSCTIYFGAVDEQPWLKEACEIEECDMWGDKVVTWLYTL